MDDKSQSMPASALPAALEMQLAEALAPMGPTPARAAAMRDALLARVRSEQPRFVTVRGSDGIWVPLAQKVAMKMLEDNGTMQDFLLKFEPGGRIDAHAHYGDELCIVIEGDCRLGDLQLGAGDYHVARSGTRHGEVSSRSGCLLFIRVPSGNAPHA